MTNKVILEYDKNNNRYFIPEKMIVFSKLYYINLTLDPFQEEWINCDIISSKNLVFIWSDDSLRQQAKLEFKTLKERYEFDKEYKKYYDKRWEEMPKIEITLENYEKLKQKFENIKKEKPKFIVFILDNSGPLDKVELIEKNELSQEDLQDIKFEHAQYIRLEKAEQIYNYDHDVIDNIWRSHADSVYDSDIEKYLDRKVGFVEHKKYTKEQIIS